MRVSIFFLLSMVVPFIRLFEFIDYSNEPYALIPVEYTYLYRENGTLLHLFNITKLEEKFGKYEKMEYDKNNMKLMLLRYKCREYLNQLTIHRNKRALNFLGTAIKFVTGTPDHDDMVLVQQKLNDLIENNNKQSIINSRLHKQMDHFTGNLKEDQMEVLFEWLASELSQIIYTINLAKMGILNTAVLSLREINEVLKVEKRRDAPLLEILEHSTFKILMVKSVYVILIRFPKLEQKCMLYTVRPIANKKGKLHLEKFVAYCNHV